MRRTIFAAAFLAGSMASGSWATEPPAPTPAPVVLGSEQLDRVTAGANGSSNAFWQFHQTFANSAGGLPELAQIVIRKLHCFGCFNNPV